MKHVDLETLKFKTIDNVVDLEEGSTLVIFTIDGKKYEMFHEQDCCENVSIYDIIGGTAEDLIGEKILDFYEESFDGTDPQVESPFAVDEYDSSTWTFYVIRTMKATITIRWLGISSGYYSENAILVELDE